jgi:hypothetical protein
MRSRILCLAIAAALTVSLWSNTARADLENPVHNGVKGAIGLGLLGANLTLIIEGAIGVRNPWLLTLIPLAVAAGGAAGGWYAGGGDQDEVGTGYQGASIALLAAGLALIIPAAILVAHGRSYRPSRDDEGFVDRTEEGMPYDSPTRTEVIPVGETQTEVVGPEEGDEPPDSPPPPTEEEAPSDGGEATRGPLYAQAQIAGYLPVGGMLRVFAEESRSVAGLRLSLTFF